MLKQEIIDKYFLNFLRNYGFKITKALYDDLNFGNEIVILESKELLIRLTIDRGELLVHLGILFEKDEWFNLSDVLAITSPEDSEKLLLNSCNLKLISEILEQYIDEFMYFFSKKNYHTTKKKVLSIVEQRWKGYIKD